MRTRFSPLVRRDLQQIQAYIATDNPRRAEGFVQEIREKLRSLGANPKIYRLRPELGEGMRAALYADYVLLFRILDDKRGAFVRIERVIHGKRDLTASSIM